MSGFRFVVDALIGEFREIATKIKKLEKQLENSEEEVKIQFSQFIEVRVTI